MVIFHQFVFAQSERKVRIDPAMAFGGKTSDYFDSVEYIPLETSSKSLFGEVDKLIITDSSFVIFDFDTHSVLFFAHNGKFITRITGGANTYISLFHDFANNNIEVHNVNSVLSNDVIAYYSYNGKLLKSITLPVSKHAGYSPVVSMGNGVTAKFNSAFLVPGNSPVDTITHLITIYKDQELYRSFFPVSQTKHLGFCSIAGSIEPPKVVQDNAFYISTPLDHKLYRITRSDTQFLFQFVFPATRVLSKEIFDSGNKKYIDNVTRRIPDDENTIIDVSNIFYRGSKLYFKLNMRAYTSYIGSESKYLYNFIYDTLSGKLVSLERITSDEKSYFLPLFGSRVNVSGLEYNSDHFYTSVSSLKMFVAYKNIQEMGVQFPEVLAEYFKTQNRKSNPVIVKMKLKE